jgi:hypothetical protein
VRVPERDGDLDSGVVAHEWGHYPHHRLADCGGLPCAGMSEGWGDFNALMMMVRDDDKCAAHHHASRGSTPRAVSARTRRSTRRAGS